jgi:hypothetical protein
MVKTKEVTDQNEHEMHHPTVDEKTEAPHKQDAPRKASGNDPHLKTADKQVSMAEKAKAVVAMQREVGNARVAKSLAKPEAAKNDSQAKPEADRGATKTVEAEAQERILHH